MKNKLTLLSAIISICLLFSFSIMAQTTGSIAGTVVDQNGAVVPNATVIVTGESGQEFTATTSDNGTYRIPAVANGIYNVSVTSPGFKKSIVSNVKVDVGSPTTIDSTLEVGDVAQTVEITSGGEVLQTQTATVGTTITGRQITETPIASRDALDLVGLLPGTATVGRPRSASINGLPKGSLSITIDGVDVQDNLLRSSDGYFTYVRPRVDAIEEVTVSTTNPGAESSGDGAVQIKFVTKRGTNDYRGGLFWQHRNTDLNANYWYSNRDGVRDANGKAVRQKIILNQYGGRLGGPLPFLNFGDRGGPIFNSGKDRAFFFVNYEEFRQPESQSRTRVILTPAAQAGNYSYIVGGQTVTRNLFTIAAANNQLSTPDPTVSRLLTQIRAATTGTGSITPITSSPNVQNFNFSPAGLQVRKFLALRFDFNLTKNHSLEFVTNRQKFVPSKDFLNGQDERFPGFPSYTQGSNRNSYAAAVRSTFGTNIVNEARYAVSTGLSEFSAGISPDDFAFQGGYALGIDAAGATTATSRNSYSNRNTPTYDFTDTVTWIAGSHNISFGGQYKLIRAEGSSIGRIVPTVSFGIDSSETIAFNMFNATNFPGASAAQLTAARGLYATLIGRVSAFTTTAFLTPDGTYQENAEQSRIAKQNTYGLFVQDSWRVRPNFTVNYGLRWQPQTAFVALSRGIYTRLENFDQVYGVSGAGNIFKPGTLTGTVPRVVAIEEGEKAYPDDWNNFAPTIGVVWSPNFGEKGFLKTLFGSSGRSVFRGGYSVSFVREGFNLLESISGSNPGGSLSASRSPSLSTPTNPFIVGTNLRDANNPNLRAAPFPSTPSFPITLRLSDSTNAFSPDLKTGSVHSFSFGYQRELDKDTVVEFRYVGNRGVDLQRQYDINEFNTIENGFAAEFALAQANLYANIAAGRGATFAYAGPGTGTSPLPILLSYFNPPATNLPNVAASYLPANFANTTLVSQLSRNAPNIIGFGSGTNFLDNATRRANGIANGRPSNFFYVNPTTAPTNIGGTIFGGSYIIDNSLKTWYDSGVIEVRRRLSGGLRLQANYVWSKAQSNAYSSSSVVFAGFTQREGGLDLAKNVQAFDIRHQFKFDGTYDLPFGRGRTFFSNANWLVNSLIGGFTIFPTIRWQSGSPFSLGNVTLVGMTVKELQKEIKVRKGPNVVTYLPDDIILNTQRAFNIDVTNTANNGYGTTFGTGGPQGKFIAPAGFGNCQQRYAGECGFNNLILYGPGFFKFDVSVAKKFIIDEKRNVELRATFLDALNRPNFRVGGWAADVVNSNAGIVSAVGGATFGQLGNGSAYQDISTTNDPGGRLIDIMLRINF
ncbi:MAG: TonB-dependent receptor [Acidobacteriota bacterium]|nr:TonB-dependent receptor [Acidobacteriota bacterium]